MQGLGRMQYCEQCIEVNGLPEDLTALKVTEPCSCSATRFETHGQLTLDRIGLSE
jgi:hypothetical protein